MKTYSRLFLHTGLCALSLALSSCANFVEGPDGVVGSSAVNEQESSKSKPVVNQVSTEPVIKKRILILPFENTSEFPQEALYDAVQAEVKSAVVQNPQLALVELDAFAPPEMQMPGRLGQPSARQLELAHLLGADAVITGTLKEFQVRQQADEIGILSSKRFEARARVFMRVTDVITQKELYGRDFVATANEERVESFQRSVTAHTELGKSAVLKALRSLTSGISQVSSRIAWTGRIARVDFQKFFINGGRKSGVFPGLLLKVFSPATDVTDRATGMSLGIAPGRFKGYLKIVENFGDDASVAVLHLGAGFREEDIVEPHFPEQN